MNADLGVLVTCVSVALLLVAVFVLALRVARLQARVTELRRAEEELVVYKMVRSSTWRWSVCRLSSAGSAPARSRCTTM